MSGLSQDGMEGGGAWGEDSKADESGFHDGVRLVRNGRG